MNRNRAFSLAEALITLLIVCIIAVVSAPMITKKAKKPMRADMWQKDAYAQSAVSVRNGYDVRFGSESEKMNQSIVVVGTMYFKDRNGKVIGWISEDGTSSFAGGAVDMNKIDQLLKMIDSLYSMIDAGKVSANSNPYKIASVNSDSVNNSARIKRPSARKITPRKIQPARGPNVPSKLGRSSNQYQQPQGELPLDLQGFDPSQLQNMSEEELQQMLNRLQQMMPAQ